MMRFLILCCGALLAASCDRSSTDVRDASDARAERGAPEASDREDILAGWPADARRTAHDLIERYGQPDEATPTQLTWHRNGPWLRTILSRDPVRHDWPTPHQDRLEQVIAYRVPVGRFDDLAEFDGSVMVERTKGEMSARCGGEPMNFLALNLAHEVVTGSKTVEEARHFYEQTALEHAQAGRPYTQSLRFRVATSETGDPDRAADQRSASR